MLRTNKVSSDQWDSKFNQISQKLENRNIDIEVVAMDLGDQFAATGVHLKGLTYEPRDNVIQIASDDFSHIINSPSEVYFTLDEESIESIKSIELIDSEDRKHIVTFEDALLLE